MKLSLRQSVAIWAVCGFLHPIQAQPNRSPRCVEKLMLVDELEYETRIKCHHTYGKSCFSTYITVFRPSKETVCKDEYDKKCYIDYSQTAVNVDVEICQDNLVRNCDLEGEEVCTQEHVTVCETTYQEYEVDEDNPICDTVQEEFCDDDGCKDIAKQVCSLGVRTSNKIKPDTKCRREPIAVCGPEACPLTMGEQICKTESRTVLEDTPQEKCDLTPQQVCTEESKLVPRLEAKSKCIDVPRENCVRMRVNPRMVKRPVIREWCADPEDFDQLQGALNEDSSLSAPLPEDDSEFDDFDPDNIQLLGLIVADGREDKNRVDTDK